MKNIKTEDTGIIFEKSICMLYNIEYDGKYKYSINEAEKLKNRISKLKEIYNTELKHIAKNGSKYDFITINGQYISAKTTKGTNKVCPQVIGQATKKKFCEFCILPLSSTDENIKQYIISNIKTLIMHYYNNTFNCDIIYYNTKKNILQVIKKETDILFNEHLFTFSHIDKKKEWKESSTLKIILNNKKISIGEFQIHIKRNSIKFRWCFVNILNLFKNNFNIIHL